MNPDNKLEKYFKKHLKDTNPSEDEWNVPSDDLWNNAKVHFPKEEKKRNPFLFILFGMGLVLGILGATYYFNYIQPSTNTIAAQAIDDLKTSNTSERINTTEINSQPQQLKEKKTNEKITTNENTTIAIKDPFVAQKIQKKTKIKPSKIKKEATTSSNNGGSKILFSNEISEAKQKSAVESSLGKVKSESSIVNREGDIINPKKSNILNEHSLGMLDYLPLAMLDLKYSDLDEKVKVGKYKPLAKAKKWEVGLANVRFLIPFDKVNLTDEDDGSKINLDLEYFGWSLSGTRRFSKRWSLTTGAAFINADFQMNFTDSELYEQGETENGLYLKMADSFPGGTIEINDVKREIEIEYIDGLEPKNMDMLELEGRLPLSAKLVSIPILVNYHLGRRNNFEFMLHSGFSLDFVKFSIDEIDFRIYNENTLITKPVVFAPIDETALAISAYVGGGVKYHLNDKINIDLSSRIDVLGPLFSRYEVGMFYRF